MVTIVLADPDIRAEQVEAILAQLPGGWRLSDQPSAATAILTENVDVSATMLEETAENLRLIVRLDTGTARVAETTVPIVDLPNTALVGVAELTVLLILALSRHLSWISKRTLAQQWLSDHDQPILTDQQRYTYNWIGLEDFGTLYGKAVGIVGMGLIGRATAERLRAFGMTLLYTQRNRLDIATESRLGVQWRTLDGLLRQSDFVTLHHRFQDGDGGNDGHIGVRELALMKSSAYLINTPRGRLVDEDALVEALRSGQIAGAGLDVYRYEPLPAEHALFDLAGDNVILTPHIGGAPVTEAWETIARELIHYVQEAIEEQ